MTHPIGLAVEWPADNVQRVAVDRLRPYPNNTRTHSRAQVAQLVASIQEWGWTTPVLVDEQGMLIAGHARLEAAKQLSIPEIPVMVARGWTEAQIRAYTIADNALPLNAGWDEALLKVEIKAIEALNFDVGKMGLDMEFMTKLFDEGGVNIAADRDEAATGVRSQHLKFGTASVVITDEELEGLNRMLARYTDQFGLSHGFAQWLLDAAA
ncbi:ParB/Srx family N-terminal domain-containing protein [Bradyrhizobium sp. RT10b]|uniref:ParB/Srx family N-terminal domain-containing protein n=1 Tax=Bradyrhizobium sp. RT10b TaxID=3156331 RepID=UPI0033957479